MTTKRGSPAIQILIGFVVVGLFLYGFYIYHEVQTRLRRTEERADRLKTQHETVSSQLQVLYEHKTRLEKNLKEEKAETRRTKEDMEREKGQLEDMMRVEKQQFEEKIISEIEKAKSQQQKFEEDYDKLTQEKQELQNQIDLMIEEKKKESETEKQQLNLQKQECDNEIAQRKDEIANLQRRNFDLETKVNIKNVDLPIEDLNKNINKTQLNVDPGLNMQIAKPGDSNPKRNFQDKSPDSVIDINQPKAVAPYVGNQDGQQVVAPVIINEVAAHSNVSAAAAAAGVPLPLNSATVSAAPINALSAKNDNFVKDNQIEQVQNLNQLDESQIKSNRIDPLSGGALQQKEGIPGQSQVVAQSQGQGLGQLNQPVQIAQPNQFNQVANPAVGDLANPNSKGEKIAADQENKEEEEEYEEKDEKQKAEQN